ncbi:MAG: oligosaccharide flippase family protein, partial [candidate division Zixibacteria bacterium]|nr:oligosaccharide flippase family protein [candidate division Zixibacteria bacterium]
VADRLTTEYLIYLLAYGLVVGDVLFPVWFFQGMERMKLSTILTLIARGIFVVLIFVFIKEQKDYILVPLLNSLGMIIAGIISLWMVRKTFRIGFCIPRLHDLSYQIKRSFQFFISRISVSAYTSLNTIVIGLVTNDMTVGYYAAAEKLFIALRAAYYPLVQALYPYMASRRQVNLFRKVFYLSVSSGVVTAVAGYFLAEPVIQLVLGDGFEPSVQIFQLFVIIVPVVVASIMMGYPFLAALGHERYANFSVAVGSVIHILMIVLLIPIISPTRVVLATMVTELLIFGIRIYGIHKYRLWRTA